ncbi:hypothetical protein HHI36_022822 [Cryptolaemus montrouzieri]|uniref:FCP1 homology domain-containing protein n=1 Tax=Cryptolaemus montrouzieri TaxID=559131 RepID=A0ABD2PF67_9CUCU
MSPNQRRFEDQGNPKETPIEVTKYLKYSSEDILSRMLTWQLQRHAKKRTNSKLNKDYSTAKPFSNKLSIRFLHQYKVFNKNMEHINKDTQDSETSSTSSWILLNTDEVTEDLSAEKIKEGTLADAIQKLCENESKNSQSDIESDGISIISEGELSHDGKSDDDNAIFSSDEKCEDNDILENKEEILELKQKELEICLEGTELDKSDDIETRKEETLIEEEIVFSGETFYRKDDDKTLTEDGEIDNIRSENTLAAQTDTVESSNFGYSNEVTQLYDYRRLLTWPSVLCTSVVILAVLIFPYFSSKIENNVMDQPDLEQYDKHLLPDKEILDVDPLLPCREIHKNDNLYRDHNIKKCVKKMLKQIKNAKNYQISRELKFLDREIDKRRSQDKQEEFNATSEKEKLHQLKKELSHKEKDLLQKEKVLKEWEDQLIEKEKKILQEDKESKKYLKEEKLRENIKRKGDFDDDLQKHKLIKNKKQKNFRYVVEENSKENILNKNRTRILDDDNVTVADQKAKEIKSPLGSLIAKDKEVVENPTNDADDDEEEAKKKRQQSWKTMKITLSIFGITFTCLGGYLIFSLGAPPTDPDQLNLHADIEDKPIWQQYLIRTYRELYFYTRLIQEPSRQKLLPDPLQYPYLQPKYTLVLEITDVLVHPDWTYNTGWRFKKRPGLDYFLESLHGVYEIVVYTAEQGMTLFPLCEAIDPKNIIAYKLPRDTTYFSGGYHVKSLDKLNRDLSKVIAIDWQPKNLKFHPENLLALKDGMGLTVIRQ